MRLHQIRNATVLLEIGRERLLVDPVLGAAASLPAFKLFGRGRRRNPLVELPPGTDELLASATGVLITHAQHADHLDRAGVRFARERGLVVWCSSLDQPGLAARGLDARELVDGCLGMRIEVFGVCHGRGLFGWLMGPVAGFYLAAAGEPSLLLTSDAVLTPGLLAVIERLLPEVLVAPAGSANFGLGPDILFSLDELVSLTKVAPGQVVFNHLEALDHCPTTRAELRARLGAEGLTSGAWIPADGECIELGPGRPGSPTPELRPSSLGRPGSRKCLLDRVGRLIS